MKRLLYITTRLPWPQDSGRKVTLYNYCKGLHDLCGYEIYLYSFLDQNQSYSVEEKPGFVSGVRTALPVSKVEIVHNLMRIAFNREEPFQNALYFSRANRRAIGEYAREVRPDAVVVDMVRLAPYIGCLSDFDCMKSLDIDDLLSRRYKRQMEGGGSAGFLGSYSDKVNGALRTVTMLSPVKRAVLGSEAARMERAEARYARLFDNVFFVSSEDAAEFGRRINSPKVFAVGMGADVDYYSAPVDLDPAPGTAAFVGNLSFDANVASVEFVAREILPRMNANLSLKVVGSCPDSVRFKFSQIEGIEVVGRVEDLRPVVEGTDFFLAPIAYGSGVKTKIVEALAMGMCVLTNSVGAEGLSAKDGVEIVVEDNPTELARRADELMGNPEARAKMGRLGQEYARRNHRWEDILKAFGENGF